MIKYPERFNQARPAGFDGVFDWDFLMPAFVPTRIQPMDFDAVIERRGRFLVFETKKRGKSIDDGQRWALERFVETGFGTVFIVNGKTEKDINKLQIWSKKNGVCKKTKIKTVTSEEVVEYTRRWFTWANKQQYCAGVWKLSS